MVWLASQQQNNERQKRLALLQDPPSAREALPPELRSLLRPKSTPSLRSAAAAHHLTWTIAPAVVLSALTLLTLLNLGREWLNYRQLAERGVSAQATVLEKNKHYRTEDVLEYAVVYQFYAPVNGQMTAFQARRDISGALYDRLKVESKIEVIYDPANPANSELRENLSAPSPLYAVWLSILLVGLAYFLLFRLPSVLARRRQLQRVLTRGEQVSKEEYEKTPIDSVRQAAYLPENPAACLLLEVSGIPS